LAPKLEYDQMLKWPLSLQELHPWGAVIRREGKKRSLRAQGMVDSLPGFIKGKRDCDKGKGLRYRHCCRSHHPNLRLVFDSLRLNAG